jgi:D-glycero-D-manno-heptose 1,7-bisphosphate phosphatase
VYHAVFIQQEGVILRARSDAAGGCEEPQFLPGALDALTQLVSSGLCVVVMSRQPHATQPSAALQMSGRSYMHIREAMGAEQTGVDWIRWQAECAGKELGCRQPGAELLRLAARELGIGLFQSYLVGDVASDVEAGRLAGCRGSYLVLTGRGRKELARCWLHGERDFRVVFDLKAATDAILLREQGVVGQPVPVLLGEMAVR